MRDQDAVPESWLWPAQISTVAGTWRVNQRMKEISQYLSLSPSPSYSLSFCLSNEQMNQSLKNKVEKRVEGDISSGKEKH